MLALLPLIAQFAPMLIGMFGGARDEAIASQVGAAVTAVTGVMTGGADSTATAMAALAGKPDLVAAMQQKLAEIHLQEKQIAADMAKADADARTAQIVAAVASQDSARRQTVDLVKAGSSIAWGAPVISAAVFMAFGMMVWLVMSRVVPSGSENIAAGLVEALKLTSMTVVGYWCGSSAGSARKDDTIAAQAGGAAPRPLAQ